MTKLSDTVKMSDSIFEFFDEAYEMGWTDGLPVLPPVPEQVAKYIEASGLAAEEVVAEVEPRKGLATVEKIAVNAVMAGCLPEYMPVLIAMVKAISVPGFNLGGIQTTTNPVSPLVIVNGEIRKKIQMNTGRNALGPGNRANATLGRALRLILLNIGGAVPGKIDKATLGMPGKYTFCLGENEEESPWDPLSVELGYKHGENIVTVVGAQGTNNVLPATTNVLTNLTVVADGLKVMGNNNYLFGGGNPVILLPPGHAQLMSKAGWTKSKVKEFLYENSKINIEDIPRDLLEWRRKEIIVENGKVPVCQNYEDILIVVVGGPEPYHITIVPNFGDTAVSSATIG
ncbi:hypothetical protein J2S00_003676 [Caldalkalibacillus uzonensis]|uniref:Thiol-disulfide oxidoreductase n=1 Tax=Caldalkalibacillus uzonensis TaxID=353224 RepID=A0ABU0CWP9_9BACI|nr:hypothetical protein [Caldalkalibacillus uzonensis]MDQ0340836.1 hypothetical protein [Caldalkalibacillus uzonensis]